jgi:hypothetical protein
VTGAADNQSEEEDKSTLANHLTIQIIIVTIRLSSETRYEYVLEKADRRIKTINGIEFI